jgi:hypothetical protein
MRSAKDVPLDTCVLRHQLPRLSVVMGTMLSKVLHTAKYVLLAMPAQLRTLIHRLVLSAPTLQKAPLCAIRALQECSVPVLNLSSLTVVPLDFIRLSRTRSLATHVQLVLPV